MSDERDDLTPAKSPAVALADLLEAAERKGVQLAEESRKLGQAGRYIADLARATRPVLTYVTPGSIEPLVAQWRILNDQEDQALGQISQISPASLSSTAGTAALIFGSFLSADAVLPFVPESDRVAAQQSMSNLETVIYGAADEQEVLYLMQNFGLDRAPRGQKSPASLFITAWRAFESPVSPDNPVSTSLIPVREAIRLAVDGLLKRRPIQERAQSEPDKITSIGRQLKRDSLPDEVVQSWAEEWTLLLGRLSAAKEQDISRDEWQLRLRRATLFLKAFLGGLDAGKVKRRTRRADQNVERPM